MNKNFKVFQIHGLTGLLFLCVVLTGLFFGFVIFPVRMIMSTWNEMLVNITGLPLINQHQAGLLWLFFVLCLYLILKNSITFKIYKPEELDEEIYKE